MNEERIAETIKEYGRTLPPFSPGKKKEVRRTWPARPARWVGVISGVVLLGAVGLNTTVAKAAPGRDMENALRDVRSLHAKTWMRYGTKGKTRLVQETWMKDGVWSVEAFLGTNLQTEWILTDSLQVVTDPVRKVSTVEPRVATFFKAKTALDYVIEEADMSGDDAIKKLFRSEGPSVNGQPTYRLTLTWRREDEGFHDRATVVILVDEKRNLPLWSETTRDTEGYRRSFTRSEYEFDVPVPAEELQPKFLPVVDLAARQNARVAEWTRRPLARAGKTSVLDVQMNREGAVFVLFQGPSVPNALVAADGTPYAHAGDYRPGGVQGDTGTQKRCGDVRGSVFVPLTLRAPSKPHFRVSVGARGFQNPGFSQADPSSTDASVATADIAAKTCAIWPDYSVDLMLSRFFLDLSPRMASTQAKYLEKQGDVDGAVERYRLAYERMKEFIKSVAYRELEPAERLLRTKGRKQEADRLAMIIVREKMVDPNTPESSKRP